MLLEVGVAGLDCVGGVWALGGVQHWLLTRGPTAGPGFEPGVLALLPDCGFQDRLNRPL